MKLSVVIPVYKSEKYLSECIDSVLHQTMQDFEIILINDGSPDNSAEICKKYVEKDKRISFFYEENSGVSFARNNGMLKAKGEYIFFLDSDDTIDNRFFETSCQVSDTTRADLTVIGLYYKDRLPRPPAMPPHGVLIRRDFLLSVPDIVFPIGIQPCEDGLFFHQLFALTDKIAFNPNGIYYYREHNEGNHVTVKTEKVMREMPIWFQILSSFYTKYNLYATRSLHLLKFVEHEPFYFRYESMSFNDDQKKEIFKIIHDFVFARKLERYLGGTSKLFRIFIKAKDTDEYAVKKKSYLKRKKMLFSFIKLLPFAGLRRKLREMC